MIRREVIEELARKEGLSLEKTDHLLKTLCGIIEEEIKKDGKVVICKFGTFSKSSYKGRTACSVRTRELIETRKTVFIRFNASRQVKERLMEEYEET